ncbi:hypothetical protein C5167_033394 [Papaver somniferum]|uniref:RRM domain-containing protein n=1 Tax=Papaver somniferum TaxID=3469 RepID=A0A4Y7KDU1_PAPSO|nr:hypothetical protein C5167_033394 [Papaver somniferum]
MPFSLKHNLNFLIPFLQMLVNVLKLYKRFRSRRKMWRRLLIGRGLPFKPARVLLQYFFVFHDFTGVPAVIDLACMRDTMNKLGSDSNKINPWYAILSNFDVMVNLPRGFGYVVYMTRAYAEKALLFMDGAQIDGNVVRARFTLSPRKKGSSPTKIVPASQKKDGVDIQKDAPHRQRDYRFLHVVPFSHLEWLNVCSEMITQTVYELLVSEFEHLHHKFKVWDIQYANSSSGSLFVRLTYVQHYIKLTDLEENRRLNELLFGKAGRFVTKGLAI